MKLSRRDWIRTAGAATCMSLFGGLALGQEGAAPAPLPEGVEKAANIDPLLEKVEQAIAITTRRQLVVGQHSPWQVVHGVLALRQDMMMKKPGGGEISGIDWMASGALWKNETIFNVTPYGGQGHPFSEKYAFEGHPTQFLGYMCEADMPLDFKFQAGPKAITVQDIINDAKMRMSEGPEVTWTLWALSHYLNSDATWMNARNEPWSIERMVQIEYQQSVLNSACGGTHGLYVLAYARNKRLAQKLPLKGWWVYADMKVKRYIQEAKSLQNRDGSFSAAYFRGPEASSDFVKRIPANGHTLEFLMCALPENELKQPWVRRGVESVAQDLIDNRKTPCDCGPLFHALHALKMYNYRANPNVKSYSERPPLQVVKESEKAATSIAPAPPIPEDAISSQPGNNVRN
ncbi:MAG: hypothetical protein V4719_07240 [Planctomycetota bacterium]